MYHHSFLFVIISDNEKIEKALQDVKPLEDCDYKFQTAPSAEKAAVDSKKPDVAFIYDSVKETVFQKTGEERQECILVAEAGNALLMNSTVVSEVSEIWIMPKQGEYDVELLKAYFHRLVRRMKQHADSRKQEICFETLIDSVPDIAWFKNVYGAHLIVNASFCGMVRKTKEQIYKQGHCYIWDASKEDEAVCLESDRIIMESRTTNTFEETIKTGADMRLLKSYKSALIDVDGEIFGTCGIAHDVTELRNMSTELDIVLDNVPFAVIVENTQDIVLNKNSRFDEYFPEFMDIIGKSSHEWKSSLSTKLLMEGQLLEVVVQSGKTDRILAFDEEPIQDIFGKTIGKIVTLTDMTLERSIAKENERTANTDYLTGLNNRRKLMHYLQDMYTRDDVILVMMDLDNFKQVNDTYGHEAGDKALIEVADILQKCFEDDFIARMGGDEFMIVISEKNADEVQQHVSDLLAMIGGAYKAHKEFTGVSASAGILPIGKIPEQERNMAFLLDMADSLLYQAKNNGKDCYCEYKEHE